MEAWTRVLVKYYKTWAEWHERLVLLHLAGSQYLIVTPDGDLYPESLSCPPMVGLQIWNGEAIPEGITDRQIYRMANGSAGLAPLTAVLKVKLLAEARAYYVEAMHDIGAEIPVPVNAGGVADMVVDASGPLVARPRGARCSQR